MNARAALWLEAAWRLAIEEEQAKEAIASEKSDDPPPESEAGDQAVP